MSSTIIDTSLGICTHLLHCDRCKACEGQVCQRDVINSVGRNAESGTYLECKAVLICLSCFVVRMRQWNTTGCTDCDSVDDASTAARSVFIPFVAVMMNTHDHCNASFPGSLVSWWMLVSKGIYGNHCTLWGLHLYSQDTRPDSQVWRVLYWC